MRQKNTGPIVREEMFLVDQMISLYYHQHQVKPLIEEAKMRGYAKSRLEHCRFGEQKTTCQKCPVHCYQKDYRKQMKLVMRYAGPRIFFYHPWLSLRHGYRNLTRSGDR